MKDWALYAVLIGLGIDVLDAVTTKTGQAGGMLYGPTGALRTLKLSLPGAATPGEAIAMVGAAGLAYNKWMS